MPAATVLILSVTLQQFLKLAVIAGLTYLVSLPYLWKGREVRRPRLSFRVGYVPALVIGIAPVVMFVGVVVVRGPQLVYTAYACLVVGLIVGTIGPAVVAELRRRMLVGWPLLLVWAYLSTVMVLAGGGMPLRLDTPIRLLATRGG